MTHTTQQQANDEVHTATNDACAHEEPDSAHNLYLQQARALAAHIAEHGQHVCDRFTGVVFDVLIICPNCGDSMEHHCCHHCCLKCGVNSHGHSFA